MKEATIEEFAQDPHGFVRAAQQERVLVTRNGVPLALVVGVEHKDVEDWRVEASADFWKLVEERRQRPTRRLEEVTHDLFASECVPRDFDFLRII